MCYLRSASGTGKEEQGQKAKEESACCIESIPVDIIRSLIAVNQGRSYYSMGICGLPMHTYTVHTHVKPCPSLCCHAETMMFNFVISMFQYSHFCANQNRKLSGSIRYRM
jgi:hypothetical protein